MPTIFLKFFYNFFYNFLLNPDKLLELNLLFFSFLSAHAMSPLTETFGIFTIYTLFILFAPFFIQIHQLIEFHDYNIFMLPVPILNILSRLMTNDFSIQPYLSLAEKCSYLSHHKQGILF